MADDTVRDILHTLQARAVCGSGLNGRVGRRGWERPRVAISNRIYKQYRLPDPWDPNAREEATPIGLGPVSLRLGEARRDPAPHLKPKARREKPKSRRDALVALPTIPKARKPPAPSPPSLSKPSAVTVSRPDAVDDRAAAVAERMRAAEAARGGTRRRGSELSSPKVVPSPAVRVRPDAEERILTRVETDEVEAVARTPERVGRGTSGRFRMAAKMVTSAPIVRAVQEPAHNPEEDITEEVSAPLRRPMPSLGVGSLDDFFGAAAQMGRLSMRKEESED